MFYVFLISVNANSSLPFFTILLSMLYSPESSGEADVDAAVAREGTEGSELYQTEDGEHVAILLQMK